MKKDEMVHHGGWLLLQAVCNRFGWFAQLLLDTMSTGVELHRKSPRATWARNKEILQAQLHVHKSNIVREISTFICILHTIPFSLYQKQVYC